MDTDKFKVNNLLLLSGGIRSVQTLSTYHGAGQAVLSLTRLWVSFLWCSHCLRGEGWQAGLLQRWAFWPWAVSCLMKMAGRVKAQALSRVSSTCQNNRANRKTYLTTAGCVAASGLNVMIIRFSIFTFLPDIFSLCSRDQLGVHLFANK